MKFWNSLTIRLYRRLAQLIGAEPDDNLFEILLQELERDQQVETISDSYLTLRYEELAQWFGL